MEKPKEKMIQEVVIYGGCGQLGRAVLALFKQNGYKTISIDRIANDDADQNIIGKGGTFDFLPMFLNI